MTVDARFNQPLHQRQLQATSAITEADDPRPAAVLFRLPDDLVKVEVLGRTDAGTLHDWSDVTPRPVVENWGQCARLVVGTDAERELFGCRAQRSEQPGRQPTAHVGDDSLAEQTVAVDCLGDQCLPFLCTGGLATLHRKDNANCRARCGYSMDAVVARPVESSGLFRSQAT